MNTPDERSAAWYRLLAEAPENPAAFQHLVGTMQLAAKDQGAAAANIGARDPAEAARFFRVADTFLRGQAVQADMMQAQRQAYMQQMDLMRQQGVSTAVTVDRFKEGMRNAIAEAESGYRITKWMYVTLFVLGIALVALAAVCGVLGLGAAWGAGLAFVGGAGTVAAMLFRQQGALESSRADLMQLQIAVSSWLDNIVRLNTVATTIGQSGKFDAAMLREIWQQSHKATEDVLKLVQTYCENRAPAALHGAKSPAPAE